MIKNFIFDMGNVLMYFKPDVFIDRYDLNTDDKNLLNDVIFKSGYWAYLDDGSMNEQELCEMLKPKLPKRLHDTMEGLIKDWDKPLIEVTGMYEIIDSLKANGYKIYLLSNASSRQHEYWDRISCSKFFDGTLISADVKMVKPNPQIYTALFDKFDLRAEECFFVDDSPQNILAGKELGMDGYIFDDDIDDLKKAINPICPII